MANRSAQGGFGAPTTGVTYSPYYDPPGVGNGAPYYNAPPQQPSHLHFKDLYKHLGHLDLAQIREDLEGPKPLRVLAAIGGLVMAGSAAIGLFNIFGLLSHPVRLTLEAYECIFGLCIVIIELKNFAPLIKDFLYKWFPFLTIVGGKGIFYIFAGSLGLSFGRMNWLLFGPALYVMGIGILYCIIHFGKCKILEDKYEKSMMVSMMHQQQY